MSTENTGADFQAVTNESNAVDPSVDTGNASVSADSSTNELTVAQAATEEIVPVDAGETAEAEAPEAQPGSGAGPDVFAANAENQVLLPANISLDNALIEGSNLILVQPDGTEITILNGALNVPTFIIDNVEIPQETLIAALGESGINIAAGPNGTLVATSTPDSAGGNFDVVNANLGEAGPILDLLGPTALQFPVLEERELFADFVPEEDSPAPTPLIIISILPDGEVDAGIVEDPDLPAGTTPTETGENTTFIATIQAGSSNVTDVVFDPYNGGTGPLSLMTTNVTGESLTATFTYELSSDGRELTILADGVPVVLLTINFDGNIDPGAVEEVAIDVMLLEAFPHEFATDLDAVIEGIRILAEDANGFNDIGTFDFTVVDDVPSVSAEIEANIFADLDEGDQDAGSPSVGAASVIDTGAITKGTDPDVDTTAGPVIASAGSGSAIVAASVVFGADGPAASDSTQYTFSLTSSGTGLFVTDGSAIELVAVGDGVVVGVVTEGAFTGEAAFAISIDADTGIVTVEQYLSLLHSDTSSFDETLDLSASGLGVVTTATDSDGDVAAITVQVGSQITFDDDGPSIDANQTTVPTLVTDDSALASGNLDSGAEQTTDSASFAGLFTSAFGADGGKDDDNDGSADADAISYALSISTNASGLVDTLTGEAVTLSVNGDGTVITGSSATGGTVFTITLDPDTGEITQEQFRAVEHDNTSDPVESGNEATVLSGTVITLTATIEDGDGDTDSAQADITAAFTFEDDGPSIDTNQTTVPTLVTDDSALPSGNLDTGAEQTTDSASFAGLFTGVFGADGGKDDNDDGAADADAISYALSISTNASGLVD
ncbi:DUF5801 repeats-in-toxin domain-containing protein, partial [Roseibium sp.]|uniref:DUF5801 repeats-in-toxin domain-containing protein n=2 Tax=Roseibium sp. TaxID=1936156 RepID=UPI003D10D598